MARIVGGFGTSHAPMLHSPPERWGAGRGETEHIQGGGMTMEVDIAAMIRERAGWIDAELTIEKKTARSIAARAAIETLGDTIREVAPDVAIIVGDDTHEIFMPEDHIPAVDIYWGEEIVHVPHGSRLRNNPDLDPTPKVLRGVPELGEHLVEGMVEQGFEISHTRKFPEGRTIGHAFDFIYGSVLRDEVMPHVPIFLNTYYQPNVPTLGRCYAMGRALRSAVESWDSEKTVAIIASGGLSHAILDEALDHDVLEAFGDKDEARLAGMDEAKFIFGTSEIRSWIVAAGAMHESDAKFNLIEYQPCYRSAAGTGCGVGFGYWL